MNKFIVNKKGKKKKPLPDTGCRVRCIILVEKKLRENKTRVLYIYNLKTSMGNVRFTKFALFNIF